MAAVKADAIRSVAFGSITGSYTTVGSPLAYNWRTTCFVNNTNGDLFISLNGTTDNYFIPANGFRLYDLATNAQPVQNSDSFVYAIGTQFYVRYSSAPTSGSLYIEGNYAGGV